MKPYHKNPRQITKKRQARLTDTLARLGDLGGIVHNLETDEIVGGNQRIAVFQDGVVEVIQTFPEPDDQGTVAHGFIVWKGHRFAYRQVRWDEDTAAEANIAANLGAGEWDWDSIANSWEPSDLIGWGFDSEALQDWKRDVAGLGNLIESEKPTTDAEPQVDRAAELLEKWGVQSGDLWRIGEHRLLCGDSTKREDVERVMENNRAEMCFTSPPYNAGVSAQLSGNTSIDDNLYKDEYDDNKTQVEYLDLLNGFTQLAFDVCDYLFINIQVLSGNKTAFLDYWHGNSDKFADVAILDKLHAAPAAAQRVMDSRFEFVLIFSHKPNRAIGTREFRGMVHNVYAGNPQRHNENADIHAATFPIDLPEHFIKTFTNELESIYEPFAGTGTTLVACQNLNRRCRAIEISPAYCSVILQRMFDAFEGIEIERME